MRKMAFQMHFQTCTLCSLVGCKSALLHVAFFALFLWLCSKTLGDLGLISPRATSAVLLLKVPGRSRSCLSLQSPELREGCECVTEDLTCPEDPFYPLWSLSRRGMLDAHFEREDRDQLCWMVTQRVQLLVWGLSWASGPTPQGIMAQQMGADSARPQ